MSDADLEYAVKRLEEACAANEGRARNIYGEPCDGIATATPAHIRALIADWRKRGEALEDFVKWSEAYPTDIFIEPDYAGAHQILQTQGGTLDAISAGIMRRATVMIGERAKAALGHSK